MKLPAAEIRVKCAMANTGFGQSAYQHEATLQNTGRNGKQHELRLERRPGLLCKAILAPDKKPSKKRADDWEKVTCHLQVIGDFPPTKFKSSEYLFVATPNWGHEVGVVVTLETAGSKTILFQRKYAAESDIWPVEIDAVQLRNSFGGGI